MQKDRDDIDRILYDKLHDVELTPPEDLLDRIEESWQTQRRRVLLWPYAIATVAAVLLLFLLLPSLEKEEQRNLVNEVARSLEPSTRGEEPVRTARAEATAASAIDKETSPSLVKSLGFVSEEPSAEDAAAAAFKPETEKRSVREASRSHAQNRSAERSLSDSPEPSDLDAQARKADEMALLRGAAAKKRGGGWNVGVYAANQGSFQTKNIPSYGLQNSAVYSAAPMEAANGFTSFRYGYVQPVGFKHDIPLSFGLTVRKYFTDRLALETGLTYSYLRSTAAMEGNYGYDLFQYLHYLGIPVTVNYTFVQFKGFSFYGAAGGGIERCVASSRSIVFRTQQQGASKNEVTGLGVTDVDLSLTAKLGVSYDLGKYMGLSFEPVVNYYFMDSGKVESYRKENPFGFSLRLGLYAKF